MVTRKTCRVLEFLMKSFSLIEISGHGLEQSFQVNLTDGFSWDSKRVVLVDQINVITQSDSDSYVINLIGLSRSKHDEVVNKIMNFVNRRSSTVPRSPCRNIFYPFPDQDTLKIRSTRCVYYLCFYFLFLKIYHESCYFFCVVPSPVFSVVGRQTTLRWNVFR